MWSPAALVRLFLSREDAAEQSLNQTLSSQWVVDNSGVWVGIATVAGRTTFVSIYCGRPTMMLSGEGVGMISSNSDPA